MVRGMMEERQGGEEGRPEVEERTHTGGENVQEGGGEDLLERYRVSGMDAMEAHQMRTQVTGHIMHEKGGSETRNEFSDREWENEIEEATEGITEGIQVETDEEEREVPDEWEDEWDGESGISCMTPVKVTQPALEETEEIEEEEEDHGTQGPGRKGIAATAIHKVTESGLWKGREERSMTHRMEVWTRIVRRRTESEKDNKRKRRTVMGGHARKKMEEFFRESTKSGADDVGQQGLPQ